MASPETETRAVLLASASPRRAELLRALAIPFVAASVDVDESVLDGEDAEAAARRLARTKARSAVPGAGGRPVLAADTLVEVGGTILGKPSGRGDAAGMLRRLSGREHRVVTAVCLIAGGVERVEAETSRVRFAPMSEEEISWYAGTGEPDDKAGGYAVQGLGARFIEEISGSFSNVVGLPARLVYRLLRDAGLAGLALPGRG